MAEGRQPRNARPSPRATAPGIRAIIRFGDALRAKMPSAAPASDDGGLGRRLLVGHPTRDAASARRPPGRRRDGRPGTGAEQKRAGPGGPTLKVFRRGCLKGRLFFRLSPLIVQVRTSMLQMQLLHSVFAGIRGRCYAAGAGCGAQEEGRTMRRLPPLTAIEAFVQVARLGSVKAAAEALALSSPALSRRIQALERFVGHPLFERRHQAVHLNPDGERLMAEIGPSIDALALAMERATGHVEMMRLRLAVPSLFASQRLMPNLPGPARAASRPAHRHRHRRQPARPARRGAGRGDRHRHRDRSVALFAPARQQLRRRDRLARAQGDDPRAGPARRSDHLPPSRHARDLRLLARRGRPARSSAGGDRPFRFGPAHPRRRRAGARSRLHAREPFEGGGRRAARPAVRPSRWRAPTAIGSPAAARR